MEKDKVLIIGAGAAGLMAARILKQKNTPFTILEATDRIGGRALTLEGLVPIEFGPEYLHGETPVTDALMEEFDPTSGKGFAESSMRSRLKKTFLSPSTFPTLITILPLTRSLRAPLSRDSMPLISVSSARAHSPR
jgi:monoamine oxidase